MKEVGDVGISERIESEISNPSPSLPHEIIENILSRLPVKDLLRYRVVCKQWKATISDPKFVEIHLQHNKNLSSQNLLAWEDLRGYNPGLHVAELRNNSIELVSVIEHSREYALQFRSKTWCSCDGLYLKYFLPPTEEEEGKPVKCVLWNPSCRTYRELYCPPSIDVFRIFRPIHALYYDPLMKDYKIVMADLVHYVVYSWRDNKWGDVKEMKGFLGDYCPDSGVFVNGSIYWLVMDREDDFEIICFDCKDESFKILHLPNLENFDSFDFQLTSFGGQLWLFIKNNVGPYPHKIMKKVDGNDEWMESKEESLCEYRSEYTIEPVCQVSENELLFHVLRGRKMVYMVYDKSKNTVVEIHNKHPTSGFMPPVSHLENLHLL